MKNILKFLLFVYFVTVFGCTGAKIDETEKKYLGSEAKVVFLHEDIIGDDNGPGTYLYPTHEIFKKGDFDLQKFYITQADDMISMVFVMTNNFENNWKMPDGWDVQMFDVYLNFGVGKYIQTLAGRNLKINGGWDKAILVAPEVMEKMKYELNKSNKVRDDKSTAENLVKDVIIPTVKIVDGNRLIVKVRKENVPDLKNLKGVQVFVLGADGYAMQDHVYNRLVLKNADTWRFGGGTDYHGNPNVIDILGDNQALINYISEQDLRVFSSVDLIKK